MVKPCELTLCEWEENRITLFIIFVPEEMIHKTGQGND